MRNKFLTPGMEHILIWMRDNYPDDSLICGTPGGWWMGNTRVSGATCNRLLRLCLISPEDETSTSAYYHLGEDGKKVLEDPEYVPRIVKHCPLAGMTKGRMA